MSTQTQSLLAGGPDQYWSDELPPSRGQYRDLALLALRVLGLEEPTTRLQATIAQVRLRAAIEQQTPQGGVPEPW